MEMVPRFSINLPDLPVRLTLDHPMSNEELLRFCAENDLLRIEREPNGDLSVMSPTGSGTGDTNSELNYQLKAWAKRTNTGVIFSSSAGFTLADGSMRSPDAAFISWPRWSSLTREQQRGFAPICPEFVIELRSPSDRLPDLQAKMGEWLRNGAELAWLIDPDVQRVEVYRPGRIQADVLEGVTSVFGEGPVDGFVLETASLWQS